MSCLSAVKASLGIASLTAAPRALGRVSRSGLAQAWTPQPQRNATAVKDARRSTLDAGCSRPSSLARPSPWWAAQSKRQPPSDQPQPVDSTPLFCSAVVNAGMIDHQPARACCQMSKPPPLFRLAVCAAVAWVSLASIALLIWILFCFRTCVLHSVKETVLVRWSRSWRTGLSQYESAAHINLQ